jgi:ribosome-binding ATPase YchF (GTP1/OBG family)
MKIAVLGLTDFKLGKRDVVDERLGTLEELMKPSKTTFVVADFVDVSGISDADGVICENEAKLDLIIADLEIVESRLTRTADEAEIKALNLAKDILEKNKCLCEENFSDEEKKILSILNLSSMKPVYFVDKSKNIPEEKIVFDAYYNSGYICFITGDKGKELRAWSIRRGTNAQDAAGAIHKDIKRGFIRAEAIAYDNFVKAGNYIAAKPFMHLEGKDYIMQDADIMLFRFNV